MEGRKLSTSANRYISGQLAKLGTTTINIVVDKGVAGALTAVVKDANVVRDAFINRLIAFLRSPDDLLKHLGLPREHTSGKIAGMLMGDLVAPTSPMKALVDVFSDPLNALHENAKRFHEGKNLYLVELPPKWDGLACFIDDSDVPGTKAREQRQREIDEMVRVFEAFELETLAPKSKEGV